MIKNLKKMGVVGTALLSSLFVVGSANAETLSSMMQRLTDQMGSISQFAVAVMFVVGVMLGGLSVLKFKEHSDNPGQAKLGKPIGYLIAAAALIGIPSYLAVFTNTLTGENHQSSDSKGSTYNSIK